MLRTLMAGVVGGVVLVVWSAVFSAAGPTGGASPHSDALGSALRGRLGGLAERLPLGPSEANAATARQASAGEAGTAHLDLAAAAQGLGVACLAATIAAALMVATGGKRKPFAERLVLAVLLGCFASAAMLIPGGRWAEFSLASAIPVFGEVVVGWLLAGMVIAVVLNPAPKRGKA